ncbi:MAG TPA: ethylbenzene dehydrogenase-related protein [Candidatus Wujingus californicus]|uniref:ethylbenzene dehydrogenase-related protein n=1 Tax=Candidatus Wujingus californicus TaxID=3367618 RepID=UPI00402995D2
MIRPLRRSITLALSIFTISIFGANSSLFAQTSQLFRTYKHEVPQKLLETPDAVAEGKKVYEKRCWYCHGIEGRGDGPASKTMFPKPRNFTRTEYKVRSTEFGSVSTDEDLFRIITSGIEGTAMPFWYTISETERWQVIYYIKTFNEQFKKDPPKIVSVGSVPSTPESVQRGQELFKETKCFECHGEDGRGNGPLTVALQTEWNMPYRARDLSKAWNFKGGNTIEDIYRTISTGFNETPMGSYLDKLSDEDRWHVAHYVKSVNKDMASDVVVKVKLIEGDLPAEPNDENWNKALAMEIPLAGQILASPRHWAPSVDAVMVRAIYNNDEIAFLVEWDDSTNKQEEVFRDSVSLQFPTKIPESLKKPYFAMGDPSGAVNLWSWKAYWNEGFGTVLEATETEPGEISELNAKGFKNITKQAKESQNVTGKGAYHNGRWKVVMKRKLKTEDAKVDIQFEIGKLIPIAFAIWDGSNSDFGGQKSVSSWYYVVLEKAVPKTVFVYVLIAIIMGASIELWFVARLRRFPPKFEEEQET